MQYRSPFLLVFGFTAVLSPLTVRAVDRAQVEIAHQNQMFIALQAREADTCDMPVPLALDAPGGCVRISRVALHGIDTLSPMLIAARP